MLIQSTRLGLHKDFEVHSEISVEEVDRYFSDLDECHALKPLHFDVHLVNHGKYIAMEADLDLDLELCCARCGETIVQSFKPHVSLKLIEASSVGSVEEVVLTEDDLDTVTYQAPNIDLNDLLLESIYLEFDDQVLCKPDCKGICLNCGQNLNQGVCKCGEK